MNDDVKGDLMQRSREWLQSCVNAATRSGVPEEADLEAFILAHLDSEEARRTRGGHMNDDVKAAVERLRAVVRAIRVDPDIPGDTHEVNLLAHIDGEQARQDAAVAAAREEQREADARFIRSDEATWDSAHELDEVIRLSPLTATPLGDRIAELEKEVRLLRYAKGRIAEVERDHEATMRAHEKAEAERDAARSDYRKENAHIEHCELKLHSAGLSVDDGLTTAIDDLITERDAWKAKAIRDPSQLAETLWSECYADLAAANVQNIAERDAAIQESVRLIGHRNEIRAERDALRAQVEAARALAKSEARPRAGGASVTSEAARDMRRRLAKDILAAMDGAKP